VVLVKIARGLRAPGWTRYRGWLALGVVSGAAGCLTVDPGDDFIPPDVQLSEDTFHCVIQPEIVTRLQCASGGPGEAGACHASRSALRLRPEAESDPPPTCEDGIPVTAVPDSFIDNFERVRVTVSSDPESSPFYRRPAGLASHPREVYPPTSAEADLVLDWIAAGLR